MCQPTLRISCLIGLRERVAPILSHSADISRKRSGRYCATRVRHVWVRSSNAVNTLLHTPNPNCLFIGVLHSITRSIDHYWPARRSHSSYHAMRLAAMFLGDERARLCCSRSARLIYQVCSTIYELRTHIYIF